MKISASTRNATMLLAVGISMSVQAAAAPMSYTGTVVTDIKMNDVLYRKAAVTVTFVGDTNDIATAPVASSNCGGEGWFFWLAKGAATVTVESKGRTHVAHLVPGQLFVALDACNGGIGFGSFTGPNGVEPAYPLGFERGTAEAISYNSYISSPCCIGSTEALTTPANMTGDAWSCIGYPPGYGNGLCAPPDPYPLTSTDAGAVFFYQPYTENYTGDGTIYSSHNGSLNRGTFSVAPAGGE